MPVHQLIIAPAARMDLKNVYQYGLQRWGQTQSDSYLENIKNQLWSLTEQPLIGVERPELLPGVRSLPIESHTVFYRVSAEKVEVIRVLHKRQHPQLHLK